MVEIASPGPQTGEYLAPFAGLEHRHEMVFRDFPGPAWVSIETGARNGSLAAEYLYSVSSDIPPPTQLEAAGSVLRFLPSEPGLYGFTLEVSDGVTTVTSEIAVSVLDAATARLSHGRNEPRVLNKDEVVPGELIADGPDIDFNGFELRVKGDLIHGAGLLKINGGKLVVEGETGYCGWKYPDRVLSR